MKNPGRRKYFVEFPETYNKVRRSYGFVSALLLFWGFIGINIRSVNNDNVNIIIDVPEAIPIVLALFVIYFGFRLFLEWNYFGYVKDQSLQYHTYGKKSNLPRFDYLFSHILGFASLLVYFLQEYLNANLLESLIYNNDISVLLVFIVLTIGLFYSFFKILVLYRKAVRDDNYIYYYKGFLLWSLSLILMLGLFTASLLYADILYALLNLFLVALAGIILFIIIRWIWIFMMSME